jgi:hypothetical protein
MSEQKFRTKEAESTTADPVTHGAPAAPTLGSDGFGAEDQRSERVPAGQGRAEPVRGAAAPAGAAAEWTLKVVADKALNLPPKSTVLLSATTTLAQLRESIATLLPEPGTGFTIMVKGAPLTDSTMSSLKDVTQVILKPSDDAAPSSAIKRAPAPPPPAERQPAETTAEKVPATKETLAATAPSEAQAPAEAAPAPFVFTPVVKPTAASATRGPATDAAASKVPPGHPDDVAPLPYTDDPTVKKDEAPPAPAVAVAQPDATKIVDDKVKAQREAQKRADDARDREIADLAAAAEQSAAKQFLTVSIGNGTHTFFTNIATVTPADIRAFIIQQDKRFAAVAVINLVVDGQPLTDNNARQLLRNQVLVLTPTTPSGGL